MFDNLLFLTGAILGFTYLVYPALNLLFGALSRRPSSQASEQSVKPATLVILARDEEGSIARKLDNVKQLDYPQLEVMVVSDGSSDTTAEIARQHALSPVVLEIPEGKGKTGATEQALTHVKSPWVFFSDATGEIEPDALRLLGEELAHSEVGCVGGRILYREGNSVLKNGFGGYQKIARALRKGEGAQGAATVISGALHGVKKEFVPACPPDVSLELTIPLYCATKGVQSRYVPEAICWESSRDEWSSEFWARVRMGLRSWSFLFHFFIRVIPLSFSVYGLHLWCHKILRWVLGPLLGLCVFGIMIQQLKTGGAGTMGWLLDLVVGLMLLGFSALGRRFSVVSFFVLVKAAYCYSFVRYLLGERAPSWTPERERS